MRATHTLHQCHAQYDTIRYVGTKTSTTTTTMTMVWFLLALYSSVCARKSSNCCIYRILYTNGKKFTYSNLLWRLTLLCSCLLAHLPFDFLFFLLLFVVIAADFLPFYRRIFALFFFGPLIYVAFV